MPLLRYRRRGSTWNNLNLNDMKKFIQWLAKVFKATITIPEYRETVKEVYVYDGDVVAGDLVVKGDLVVEGSLEVYGNVSAKGGIGAYGLEAKVECLKN